MSKLIKHLFFLLILFVFFSVQASMTQIHTPNPHKRKIIKPQDPFKNLHADQDYGKIPLYFISNEGQVNEKVLFYAKTSNYTLWLTEEELVFDGTRIRAKKGIESQRMEPKTPMNPEDYKYERDVSRIRFLNANQGLEIVPMDETEHIVNYFIGDNESKWRRHIRTSKAVLYKDIYPDIDLKVYGVEKKIEVGGILKEWLDLFGEQQAIFLHPGITTETGSPR